MEKADKLCGFVFDTGCVHGVSLAVGRLGCAESENSSARVTATGEGAIKCCRGNTQAFSDRFHGHLWRRHERTRRDDVVVIHGLWAPAFSTKASRMRKAGTCSFGDELSLELAQRAKEVEDQFAARRCRVQLLGQRLESDASCAEVLDRLDQLPERPSKPVELPHHERIARAQVRDGGGELWAVTVGARRSLFKYSLTPRCMQRFDLEPCGLVRRADPRVPDPDRRLRSLSKTYTARVMRESNVRDGFESRFHELRENWPAV